MNDNVLDISEIINGIYADATSETDEAEWRYLRSRLHQEVKQILFKRGISNDDLSRLLTDVNQFADKHEEMGRKRQPPAPIQVHLKEGTSSPSMQTTVDPPKRLSSQAPKISTPGSTPHQVYPDTPDAKVMKPKTGRLRFWILSAIELALCGLLFLATHLGVLSVDPNWPLLLTAALVASVFVVGSILERSLRNGLLVACISIPYLYFQLLHPIPGTILFQVPWVVARIDSMADTVWIPTPDAEMDRAFTTMMDRL